MALRNISNFTKHILKLCAEKEKYPNTPCVFNTGDLNLAIGSAVSLAADLRVDNRVMFSIGKAAINKNNPVCTSKLPIFEIIINELIPILYLCTSIGNKKPTEF